MLYWKCRFELEDSFFDEVMQKGNPDIYALEYIAPVTLMIQLCDREPDRKEEVLKIIDQHIDVFTHKYFI